MRTLELPVARTMFPVLVLLGATGCDDYLLGGGKGVPGGDSGSDGYNADTGSNGGNGGDTSGVVTNPEITSNASINVMLQYSGFGSDATNCMFDVAFYTVAGDDGYGSGGTAQMITMPTDPGTCAFTSFNPDDTGTGGSMTVLGTMDAGDELHASNGSFDLSLTKQTQSDGSIRYHWGACDQASFPFAQALTLTGTGVDGGIAAFSLPDVIAVGPDITQVTPATSQLDLGILPVSVSQPLDWAWAWSAAFPSTSEGPVGVSQTFVIRNQRTSDNQLLEALACMPTHDGSMTISAADLSQLTPDPGDNSTYASAQVDTYFMGAPSVAPWGQTVRAQSLISISGLLRLSE